jgi:hypothetical protein
LRECSRSRSWDLSFSNARIASLGPFVMRSISYFMRAEQVPFGERTVAI